MNASALLPLAVALCVALLASASHRRIRPELAAALLTASLIGATLAVVPVLIVVPLSFLAHHPWADTGLGWCRAVLGLHADVDPRFGGLVSMIVVAVAWRVGAVIRAWRHFRRCDTGAHEVVDSDGLFAYALPGAGRRVAVSAGLIEALDPDEFAIVMAHERGHTEHRHDRHLLIADLAVAIVPLVAPLRRRLRFVLERWADEVAVESSGGDRVGVARTLARVALAQTETPTAHAAFNGVGVAARVEALLRPPMLTHQHWWSTTAGVGVVAVIAAAGVQLHHLVGLLETLCPH